jgi:hypothetical protein
MNKLVLLALLTFTLLYPQPLSSPSGFYIGLKVGVNHCVLDYSEPYRNLSGKGLHGGISVGFDIQPWFTVSMTPQIKSSSYLIGMWPGTDYHYTNLFLPTMISLKLLSTQSISPYLGIGGAVNFQISGKTVDTEWGTEQPIENLRNDLYFATRLGIEKKFARLRITPEFSFNYNLTPTHPGSTDIPVSIYDFNLAVALCYVF